MTGAVGVSIRRHPDRAAVVVGLIGVTTIAWVVTLRNAGRMSMPEGPMHTAAMQLTGANLLLVTGVWAAMMVGMMVPTAIPMVLAYSDSTLRGSGSRGRVAAVGSFLLGYVLVWLAFSVLAAGVQMTLDRVGALTMTGSVARPAFGGSVLVIAGLFQVTPWKEACLRRCRTPVGFLIAEWRDGARGGLIMGVRHGAYCLGCCWALMGVLFVVGTMHLVGMALIAAFVLAEKVAPRILRVRYASASVLIVWGGHTLLAVAA